MTEKHTPGPWAAHDTQFGDTDIRKAVAENLPGHGLPLKCVLGGADGCQPVAHTDGIYNGTRDLATEEANARLIAAAPELYEALELFERQWNACGPNSDFGRYFQNVRDAARSALSKARTP